MKGKTGMMVLMMLALAAGSPHAAAPGSSERRAILDALRPSVEVRFGVPVQFVPSQVCVMDGWSVVIAEPRRKDGGAVPWRRAMDRDAYELGGVEVTGVLRFRQGRWNLIRSEIGQTDVWYEGLVPRALARGC
jgi:hypothetical protein